MIILCLLSIFIYTSSNNEFFYNINIKSIIYELTFDSSSYIKVIIFTKEIINKDLMFNAYLKSNFTQNYYLLNCFNKNNYTIVCIINKKNIIFDMKEKYYFFYNYSNNYYLTFNNKHIFEDKHMVYLIFKPKIKNNTIIYENKKKFYVNTNKQVVNNGYLYILKKSKKILFKPKDGFNKYIELNNYISHAGLSGYFPQSSLIAYKEAIRRGFHIVDADIQFTKDKIPVICHGKILNEISNGEGILTLKTLKELKSLDFGNKDYKNIKIITFEELLKICKENNIIIDLDLFHMDFQKYFNETDEYAKIIINTVEKYNYFNSLIFNSGHNIQKISILKKIKSDITISIDDTNCKKNIEKIKDKFKDSKRIIYNMGNLLYGNTIDEETVKYGISLGHKIKAAKVNNLEFANKILNWGVNYLTTQYLEPFLIKNEKEEPIIIKCTFYNFNGISECNLKDIKLMDNEIYNIYYSENIYNLSENINESPIGTFKYINTNSNHKLFYSIKYLNFSEGIIQLFISNKMHKGETIKGIIGPDYDNVANCYQYNFICEGTNRNYINCKILKNDYSKIEFKGNYTIYYLENYSLNNKEIEILINKNNKNSFYLKIHFFIIILLIIKYYKKIKYF